MDVVIETRRLQLRRLCAGDFAAVAAFLQDPSVMYAWEHGFSDREVEDWLAENARRYERDGYSYFAALDRASGLVVGAVGPLVETVGTARVPGVAYILRRDCWGRGYAFEGARASAAYLFEEQGTARVCATIRPDNAASRQVAERLGMRETGSFVKHYRGKEMPHLL